MTTAPSEFVGQYVTEAVESGVLDAERETVGHVGLFDADDLSLNAAVSTARRLPGPVAVFRSSERAYHLWALSVRPLAEWQRRADDLDALDAEHLALNYQRETAVLRLDAKVSVETGDEIKPAPSLRRLLDGSADAPLSRPHLRLLADDLDAAPTLALDGDGHECVGEALERRVYMADIGGR